MSRPLTTGALIGFRLKLADEEQFLALAARYGASPGLYARSLAVAAVRAEANGDPTATDDPGIRSPQAVDGITDLP